MVFIQAGDGAERIIARRRLRIRPVLAARVTNDSLRPCTMTGQRVGGRASTRSCPRPVRPALAKSQPIAVARGERPASSSRISAVEDCRTPSPAHATGPIRVDGPVGSRLPRCGQHGALAAGRVVRIGHGRVPSAPALRGRQQMSQPRRIGLGGHALTTMRPQPSGRNRASTLAGVGAHDPDRPDAAGRQPAVADRVDLVQARRRLFDALAKIGGGLFAPQPRPAEFVGPSGSRPVRAPSCARENADRVDIAHAPSQLAVVQRKRLARRGASLEHSRPKFAG